MEKRESFAQAISDILVKNKDVTADVIKGVQNAFGSSSASEFDDFLLEEGIVTKEALLKALERYYEVPSVDVVGKFFDHLLLKNFPLDFLVRNAVIPYQEENLNMLVVVAANPSRAGLESEIRNFTNYDIVFLVGLRQDIIDTAREYYDNSPVHDIKEDSDVRQEHHEDMEAYEKIWEGEQEEEQEVGEDLSKEDDIRS